MTIEEAIKVAETIREDGAVWEIEAWKVVSALVAFLKYYEATCKPENRPSDARSTTKWVDMPESPNEWESAVSRREHEAVKDRLTKVEESIEELKAQMKVWAYD